MNVKYQTAQMTIVNADVFTTGLTISGAIGYAMQAVWSSGMVGTVKLQATVNGLQWSDITGTSQAISGANSYIWNVANTFYDQVRVYFTYTSGSGIVVVNLCWKGYRS